MFRSYRIGTLFGFPIEVNLSFLILLGVVLIWFGGLLGVSIVLLAFGSVLLHELGHALVARHLGVPISGIELHFFGGAAKMTDQPRTAGDEIAIAAAGPAVSFALGGLGLVLGALTGVGLLALLGWLNLIIGAFNLIPALPMDGGRILRALLTRKMSFVRATEISVFIARGFAILLGVYGLFTLQLYLVMLAVVLWLMGASELRTATLLGGFYGRDRSGYRRADWRDSQRDSIDDDGADDAADDDVEVLPRGFWDARRGQTSRRASPHRPARPGGFVVRSRGGRLYIDIIE
jgi:Zn-dependent protease